MSFSGLFTFSTAMSCHQTLGTGKASPKIAACLLWLACTRERSKLRPYQVTINPMPSTLKHCITETLWSSCPRVILAICAILPVQADSTSIRECGALKDMLTQSFRMSQSCVGDRVWYGLLHVCPSGLNHPSSPCGCRYGLFCVDRTWRNTADTGQETTKL